MNGRRSYNKVLSWLLVIAMVIGMMPLDALNIHVHAAEPEEIVCEHHTEHTADCGYTAAVEGVACGHVHDENCGYSQETECTHTHDEACGYVAATEGTECTWSAANCAECAEKNDESEQAVDCTCGTDDEAIHATDCATYVAPENPQCYCMEKCTADAPNVWCDVCGVQGADACQAQADQGEAAAVYADTIACWEDTNDNGTIDSGETTYGNLYEPLSASKTVKLADDISLPIAYTESNGAEYHYIKLNTGISTLDLNGHTLTFGSFTHPKAIELSGTADLTIKDSAGGGVLQMISNPRIFLYDSSKLTLAGGFLNSEDTYFFDDERNLIGGDRLTITGGTYQDDPSAYVPDTHRILHETQYIYAVYSNRYVIGSMAKIANVFYNGQEQKPVVSDVKTYSGDILTEGQDYTVRYSRDGVETTDFTNLGRIYINVYAIGEYHGGTGAEYYIMAVPITADMVSLSATEFTYNGSAQKPTVTVTGLVENTDYTVSYKRNGTATTDITKCGNITIAVTGIGNYTGAVEKEYTIQHKWNSNNTCEGCNVSKYSYVEYSWNGTSLSSETKLASNYTKVSSSDTAWTNGWYIAEGNVTISDRVTITGDVYLILMDGAVLTLEKGINLSEGNSLTIYGQELGSGVLKAVGSHNNAAIGGSYSENGGTLEVHGGIITATGGNNAAGIGGGLDGAGGTVAIYDGTVTAEAVNGAAGIGCGSSGTGGVVVAIYGGSVKATGSGSGAGIGGDASETSGTVTICGGTVTATGGVNGAGIGGGYQGTLERITISGGTVTASGGRSGGAGIGGGRAGAGSNITISGGTVTANGSSSYGAGIGGSNSGAGGTVTITGGNIKATGYTTIGGGNSSSSNGTLTDGNGNNVSLNTITLDGAADGSAVTAFDSNVTYGLNDVKTLDTNKLYFYLPANTAATSITAGGSVYNCRNGLTYYAGHKEVYQNITETTHDVVCERCTVSIATGAVHVYKTDGFCACGRECAHADQTGICGICGKVLHTHEWEYKVDPADENKIVATCKNTDNSCDSTDGGYVTIAAPTALEYTGSAIEAVVDKTNLKTGDEISVVYTPTDKLTDGKPVNVGTYTATITLGEGDNKAEISTSYEITKAAITDISVAVDSVTAPVAGNAPDTAVDNGTGYSAEIKWNTTAEKYDYNTEYTATLTLTPDANHTFGTVSADGWNVVKDNATGVVTLTKAFTTAKEKIVSVSVPNSYLDIVYEKLNDMIAYMESEEDYDISVKTESGQKITLDTKFAYDGEYSVLGAGQDFEFDWTINDPVAENYDFGDIAKSGKINVINNVESLAIKCELDGKVFYAHYYDLAVSTFNGEQGKITFYDGGNFTYDDSKIEENVTLVLDETFDSVIGAMYFVVNDGVLVFDNYEQFELIPNYDFTNSTGKVYVQNTEVVQNTDDQQEYDFVCKESHTFGTDTQCDVCGYTCYHTNWTEDGKCTVCEGGIDFVFPADLTYNGNAVTVTIKDNIFGKTNDDVVITAKTGSALTDGKAVNAGDYTVSVKISDSKTISKDFTIAKRPVTATITVNDKDYDGSADATVTEIVINNKVDGDDVTVENGTATFVSPKAGENKTVTFAEWTLTGDEAENYVLTAQPADTTATISKVALTVTAKDYTITYGDAPANNGVSYSINVGAGELKGTLVYDYNYKQFDGVIGDYTITPSGLTSDNYEITFVPGKLTVTQKEIGIEWGDATFTYDGNTKLPAATAEGAVNGDVITLKVDGAQTEASAEAYTATVTGITGDDAGNYKLPTTNLKKEFTISNASQGKPVVSGTNETINGKSDGIITGVDSTMEWRLSSSSEYNEVESDVETITDLEPGTYYVRYAAKTNYDASPDAEVVIGAGRNLTVTVPQTQTGYTLTVDEAELKWNGSVTLTFALANGYSKVDNAFAVKVGGTAVELDANGKYTVSNVKSNVTITVEGVADITAPTAEISIGTNTWNSLLNTITFGKFFKETQTVTITADDVNTGSGLNKVYYYLATEKVDDLTAVEWKEYTDAFNINPDNAYIIYAKATDHAGNAVTISSEGLILDATKPAITGIENGGTYYGNTTITATDKYLDTVTVDNEAVELTDGKYTIQADNKEHTVKATDKSGNATEYKITVYKIHTVTYKADGVVVAEIPVNHGSNVTNVPEIPTKTGYTQTAPTWDKDGKNITADTTINAVYTINEYTVTYRASGETIAEIPVKHGGDVTNVPAIPEKTGYTQIEPTWESDGKNITEDTEINAVYVINKYYVTYKADGETVDILEVNHGSNVTDVPAIPVKEGYTQTAPTWDNDGKNITDHITINAVYTINKYTVNYVANGVTVDTQTVEHGKNATAPEIPEKTGYTQTAPVWDKDGKNITDDTTITAVYTINKYTVTYKADGEVVDTQTVEHGSDAVVPAVPVKEGYDQTPGQWSHNGKNITADTTINAVYSINGYNITVPQTQTGYTLTVDKTYVEWGSDAVLTFTLADGYSKTEAFAVKVGGTAVELDANGKYTVSNVKSNVTITVEGVADITAPEAKIKIGDSFWNTLLNNITFGKFFKETQKVEITAADVNTGSGLDKIYYYLATEEVNDLTAVEWTEYTGSFNIEPNAEVIIYAWAEDNAGNDKYISSTGLVLDNIAPFITGITDGATYYGTVGYEVDETYVASVRDNDSEVTLANGKATIAADGKAHVILVTDKAGNTATVTVTVKPVEDIDDSITVDNSNVTSDDKEEIQGVIDSIDNILNDENSDLTEEEKSELEDLREEAQDLLDKIAGTEKAVEDAITDADGFKADEVTSDDKGEIEDLIKEIEDLIGSDNTTAEQKAELKDAKEALEDRIQEIEDAAQAVEDAKAPVKDITSDNITADDSDELKKAKETLEELKEDSTYTEEEKAEIQAEIDRITELEEKIAEVAKEVSDLIEAADGYDKDTVTSKDKDALEDLIEEAEALLETDNLTDEQKESVEAVKADAEALIQEIEDAASDITTEDVKEVEDITSGNVGLDDKENLEEALEDLKAALEENDGNYTEEEKAAIEEDIARIEDALESIEKAEDVIDQITELPAADDVETDDEDVVADVQEIVDAYDKLTDHEKSLIDEELISKLEDVQDKLSDYKIIAGADGSYTKGGKDGLEFTANGALSKFTGIKVDGTLVAEDNYTAKAGGTVITLKASYLETLTTGKHELTVVYTDGEASCSFEVKAQVINNTDKDVTSPDTGDHSQMTLWLVLIAVSGMLIAVKAPKKRRYRK